MLYCKLYHKIFKKSNFAKFGQPVAAISIKNGRKTRKRQMNQLEQKMKIFQFSFFLHFLKNHNLNKATARFFKILKNVF